MDRDLSQLRVLSGVKKRAVIKGTRASDTNPIIPIGDFGLDRTDAHVCRAAPATVRMSATVRQKTRLDFNPSAATDHAACSSQKSCTIFSPIWQPLAHLLAHGGYHKPETRPLFSNRLQRRVRDLLDLAQRAHVPVPIRPFRLLFEPVPGSS